MTEKEIRRIPLKFGDRKQNPFEWQMGLPSPVEKLEEGKSRVSDKQTSGPGIFDQLKFWGADSKKQKRGGD